MQTAGTLKEKTYRATIRQHLKTAYLLSDEKTEEVLPVFYGALLSHLHHLEEVLASGDLEQLGKTGHTVKGALLNLGLPDLAALAYTIEKKGKEHDNATNFSSLVTQLKEEVESFALGDK